MELKRELMHINEADIALAISWLLGKAIER
jgi:hypothetical protein